ncbi:MAG: substrate-binding domain-containing protein [Armatimonadota bacterium]|nr:substrate-binding domain-containing protein [Armatimonadota bacterium]
MRIRTALVTAVLPALLTAALIVPTLVAPRAAAQARQEVVVVVKITGIPWFNRMAKGVEEAGPKFNVKASQVGPSTADAAAQVSMVEDVVNRGVGAVAVVPTDAKALAPVFTRAREKKIVVLTHESPFETAAIDYDIEMIDSDAYGRLAIDEVDRGLKQLGIRCSTASPCGFVMLVGGLTVPLHNYWADVALKYAREKYPYLKELTSRLPTAESVDDSRKAVLDLTKTYGERLHAVIGWGSLGPLGAAAAVREKGLRNKVVVGGSAIPSSAVAYLADGSMKWAQLWDPRDAGYAMVAVASTMLKGTPLATGMEVPGLGKLAIKGKVISFNKILLMRSADDARKMGF